MGLLPVLVYYASVAKTGRVLAEYKNRASSRDLAPLVVECLEQVPPLHSRFTLTIKRRIFTCLIEGAFTYSCIVDEALGKSDAFGFLEAVRDEFITFLDARGLRRDGEGLESVQPAVHKEFGATMRVLTLPLIGVPQKEIDSLRAQASPSGSGPGQNGTLHGDLPSPKMTEPLYSGSERSDGVPDFARSTSRAFRSGKSRKMNGQVQQGLLTSGGDEEHGRIDIVVVDNNTNNNNINMNNNNTNVNNINTFHNNSMSVESGDLYPHRKSFSVREAESRWWRNVKIVLIVDVVVCIILFVIWLGICRGFQCLS